MKESVRSILIWTGDVLEKPMIWIDRLIEIMPFSDRSRHSMMRMKYGVVGTLLFHLLVILLFMIFNVGKTTRLDDSWIYFDLKTIEELQQLEAMKPEPKVEEAVAARQARNIAVSQQEDRIERYDDYENYRLSNRAVDQIVQGRIKDAVKEIVEENDLNPDDREIPDLETKPLDFFKAQEFEEDQVYEGPTNIYYKLDDRKVSYLHIPVYKCAGSGTVRIDIRVGQRGKVELATVNGGGTDTRDPCFLNAARDAAQRTRFNFSSRAPMLQQGYIIYHFVAQ